MSRKPQTPNDDAKPAGTNQEQSNIPVGKRFSGNKELLETERELVADGVELDNRAIPVEYHKEKSDHTTEERNEIIELELEKDAPNKNLIGYLNQQWVNDVTGPNPQTKHGRVRSVGKT